MAEIKNPEFPYLSFNQALAALDCSKHYLYSLIKKEIITPYYFEYSNDSKPLGKPYFKISELANALIKKAS